MFDALLAETGVREEVRLSSTFGVMAYHGGWLEKTTDVIADEVALRASASYYAVIQPEGMERHIPSIDVDPAHSPALQAFLEHVDVAVSLHGYGRDDLFHSLLLGGRNRTLANHVADHLRPRLPDYDIVTDLGAMPRGLTGQHARNPVNRPNACGVQIELPPTIRWNRAEARWSDMDGAGRAPHVDDLIAGLVDAVVSWPNP